MGRRKNNTSVAEPIAKALQKYAEDQKRLAEYLGCSLQAVNQYRLGKLRPSLENLCKIADFYGVTTDYLLGRTEEPTANVNRRIACDYTGLTPDAAEYLHEQSGFNAVYRRMDAVNFLIENERFQPFLDMLIGFATSRGEKVNAFQFRDGYRPAVTEDEAFFAGCISELMKIFADAKVGLSGFA